jgi:TPR repeat protein
MQQAIEDRNQRMTQKRHPRMRRTTMQAQLDRAVSPDAQVSVEAKNLLTRADLFLRQGDIGAARVVLERAIEMGSAEAGYRLTETNDPRVLSSWRAMGTRGDPAKARELYARAYADGIQQAKHRMNALH